MKQFLILIAGGLVFSACLFSSDRQADAAVFSSDYEEVAANLGDLQRLGSSLPYRDFDMTAAPMMYIEVYRQFYAAPQNVPNFKISTASQCNYWRGFRRIV